MIGDLERSPGSGPPQPCSSAPAGPPRSTLPSAGRGATGMPTVAQSARVPAARKDGNGEEQPVVPGALGLLVQPVPLADGPQHGQCHRSGEHQGVDLDGDVREPVVQQQVPVPAGDARAGHAVRAGVDERAGRDRVARVDHDGVPVLTDEHGAAVPGEDTPRLGDSEHRLRQGVQHLVGAVSGERTVVEGQRGGVRDPELGRGPPLGGDLDHRGIHIDADGLDTAAGQLASGPPGSAADVEHAVTEVDVGTSAQFDGLGQVVDGVEHAKQRGHVRHRGS